MKDHLIVISFKYCIQDNYFKGKIYVAVMMTRGIKTTRLSCNIILVYC